MNVPEIVLQNADGSLKELKKGNPDAYIDIFRFHCTFAAHDGTRVNILTNNTTVINEVWRKYRDKPEPANKASTPKQSNATKKDGQ